MNLPHRPRRNRKSSSVRGLVRESTLDPQHFIYPLFLHEGDTDEEIESMPGCKRWSLEGLVAETEEALGLGVTSVVLFPAISEKLKTPDAEECANDDGLVPRAIRALKQSYPELTVITDVALDPYNSDGHDGVVDSKSGRILNDTTVEILCRQAACHARAGADIVAPSDMMDGRVAAIREHLDMHDHEEVSIMAYTAKYASAFYGPFRGALESAPKSGDKKTYQMDPANSREAIREAQFDEEEGADILMVKPAGPYLDIISPPTRKHHPAPRRLPGQRRVSHDQVRLGSWLARRRKNRPRNADRHPSGGSGHGADLFCEGRGQDAGLKSVLLCLRLDALPFSPREHRLQPNSGRRLWPCLNPIIQHVYRDHEIQILKIRPRQGELHISAELPYRLGNLEGHTERWSLDGNSS